MKGTRSSFIKNVMSLETKKSEPTISQMHGSVIFMHKVLRKSTKPLPKTLSKLHLANVITCRSHSKDFLFFFIFSLHDKFRKNQNRVTAYDTKTLHGPSVLVSREYHTDRDMRYNRIQYSYGCRHVLLFLKIFKFIYFKILNA